MIEKVSGMRKRLLVALLILCGLLFLFLGLEKKKNQRISMQLVSYSEDVAFDSLNQIIMYGKGECIFESGESYFILSFDGKINLKKLDLIWEIEPDTVEVIDTDYSGVKNFSSIKAEEKVDNIETSYLKICIGGEKRSVLKGITIWGNQTIPDYLYEDGEILFDAYDVRNPLRVWRVPIKRNIQLLSDGILGNEKDTLSEHEKIIKFMEYVQQYKIGNTRGISEDYLTELARDQIGACGDYSNIVAALAAMQGIDTHIITLANYPEGSGHVVIEAYIDPKWSLYDPTFCLYYTTTPSEKKRPYVLGFAELKDIDNVNKAVKVIEGDAHITTEASYDYMGPAIYSMAKPAGIVDINEKLYYENELSCDSNIRLSREELRNYQGATYIGIAGMNSSHIWNLYNLTPGETYVFTIMSSGIQGEIFDDFRVFAQMEDGKIVGEKDYVFSNTNSENLWQIQFVPEKNECEITLDYNETSEYFHYIPISELRVEKGQ